MRTIFFCTISLLFITNYNSFSQGTKDSLQMKNFHNNIGGAAGFTTGYGLSYKHLFNKIGFQITFGPSYNNSEGKANISSGLTLFYLLSPNDANNLKFYLYMGNHYYYKKHTYNSYNYHTNTSQKNTTIYDTWNTGLGIDINCSIGKRCGVDFMFGYAQYSSFDKLNFTAETGWYYKF